MIGPQKPQNNPKKQKIKESENKKAYKKKVICQYKQSPKKFSELISTPKLPQLSPKKMKIPLKKTKNKKNQKTKIFKNEIYQFTLVNPQKLLRPHPDPKKISR